MVQVIPNNIMSTFLVPKNVCNSLDALGTYFWWTSVKSNGDFLALKFWTKIYRPKDSCAFGIWLYLDMNLVL